MLTLYRVLTSLATPLLPVWLWLRRRRGKEHAARLAERRGKASWPRPAGSIIWLHGASVGETLSALPLVHRFTALSPDWHILVTTGTVTSAKLLAKQLPDRACHQFIPLDSPYWVSRFLDHWRPDLALWLESEIWPNLIIESHKRGIPMVQVNARMTARSFRRWRRAPAAAAALLGCFKSCLPRTPEDAERFRQLGAPHIGHVGNIKAAAPPLSFDAKELAALQSACRDRPLWLAASFHGEEDAPLFEAHRKIAADIPGLLSLFVPRHPERGPALAEAARSQGLTVACRAAGEVITPEVDIYLADTLGELGLFYRLTPVAFIGGSLFPHGGQNPLEAARLETAVLFGPHMHNFTDAAPALVASGGAEEITTPENLASAVQRLLTDPAETRRRQVAAKTAADVFDTEGGPILDAILAELQPWLPPLSTETPQRPMTEHDHAVAHP